MLDPLLDFWLANLGALFVAGMNLKGLSESFSLKRVTVGLLAGSGLFVLTLFLLDSFFWKAQNPSLYLWLIFISGIGNGLSHSLFAWITTQKMYSHLVGGLVLASTSSQFISPDYQFLRRVSLVLAVLLLVCRWLLKTARFQNSLDGSGKNNVV